MEEAAELANYLPLSFKSPKERSTSILSERCLRSASLLTRSK